MRVVLILLGLFLVLTGLLFVGQGSGWFPYPSRSFMVGASPWETRGAVLAAIGVVVLLLAFRGVRR